jgi:hypothetical protein
LLPKVKTVAANQSRLARGYADWDALAASWRRELEALGQGFARGDARVDPKDGAETCKQCDQQLFCRIAERMPLELDAQAAAMGGTGDG